MAGSPRSWEQTARAATLAPSHPVLAFASALRLHELDGFEADDGLDVLVTRGSHPVLPAGVRSHTSRRLRPIDIDTVRGMPVTNVATTLVQSAGVLPPERLEQALDSALRRSVSPTWLRQTATRWRGKGVPGSGVLDELLIARLDRPVPRSWFERLAQRALAEHGFELEHEVVIRDGRRVLAYLDLADRRWLVGVECQSWRHHADPTARRRDLERKRRLRQLGWDIVEFWWSDLERMDAVLADIQVAYDRQRRLLEAR